MRISVRLLQRKIARTSADNKKGDGLTLGTADFSFVLMDDACQRQVIHLNSPLMRGLVRGRRTVSGIAFRNPESRYSTYVPMSLGLLPATTNGGHLGIRVLL